MGIESLAMVSFDPSSSKHEGLRGGKVNCRKGSYQKGVSTLELVMPVSRGQDLFIRIVDLTYSYYYLVLASSNILALLFAK